MSPRLAETRDIVLSEWANLHLQRRTAHIDEGAVPIVWLQGHFHMYHESIVGRQSSWPQRSLRPGNQEYFDVEAEFEQTRTDLVASWMLDLMPTVGRRS